MFCVSQVLYIGTPGFDVLSGYANKSQPQGNCITYLHPINPISFT